MGKPLHVTITGHKNKIIQYEAEIAVLNYSPYLSAITQSYTTFYSGDGVSFEKIKNKKKDHYFAIMLLFTQSRSVRLMTSLTS